jgi:hypothetical protein
MNDYQQHCVNSEEGTLADLKQQKVFMEAVTAAGA